MIRRPVTVLVALLVAATTVGVPRGTAPAAAGTGPLVAVSIPPDGAPPVIRRVPAPVPGTLTEPVRTVSTGALPGGEDPWAPLQWNLDAVGADRARRATGSSADGVVVAVVDTGVDRTHPDLVGRVLDGIDLLDGGPVTGDPNGHGTHVAGIIAAAADNQGIRGVTPGVVILPVRVLAADGTGDTDVVARGVIAAVEAGARVVNLSLGSEEPSEALAAAVDWAVARGTVVVAAAGNRPGPLLWPAALPETVSVGATAPDGTVPEWSASGSGLDLVAPGVGILSTWPGGTWRAATGTSMAAPHVSAAAALAGAVGRDPAAIEGDLRASAVDLGPPGVDGRTGAGALDMVALAARWGYRPPPDPEPDPGPGPLPDPVLDPPPALSIPTVPDPGPPEPPALRRPTPEPPVLAPPGPDGQVSVSGDRPLVVPPGARIRASWCVTGDGDPCR